MFLLHEYNTFWTFLIIASFISILIFWISGFLTPISEGLEKLSTYESGLITIPNTQSFLVMAPKEHKVSDCESGEAG